MSGETRASLEDFLSGFSAGILAFLEQNDLQPTLRLLDEWSGERTQSDLENRAGGLVAIIQSLSQLLLDAARSKLPAPNALALVSRVQPLLSAAISHAVQLEMEAVNRHVLSELEETHQNLERLERSKSDFISIAAHELRTPLTLIDGYLAMLKEHWLAGDHSNELQLLFDGMHNGSRRLRQIVDDMVDVSLIDNQLLSLNFQPLWLDRIFEGLSDELAGVIKQRGQTLEMHAFPGSSEMIFGDEERLIQAFRNLLTNAIKYTPDGGKISIDGRRLPGYVDVLVQDTGIGILPENQAAIFEKFGRQGSPSLHSSSKTGYKGGGPGLGLPITKGIISAHGGAIWVESETCDEARCPGSTFHVVLPMLKSPPDNLSAKLFHPLSGLERSRNRSAGDQEENHGKEES